MSIDVSVPTSAYTNIRSQTGDEQYADEYKGYSASYSRHPYPKELRFIYQR